MDALIPYEISVNTTLQLLVQRGATFSVPVQVNIAPAQPAIFSSGPPQSAGLIYAYPPDGSAPSLVTPAMPAHAGDAIVVYCLGLGSVSPAVTDGAAPGAMLSYSVSTAQLTIGGQVAPVFSRVSRRGSPVCIR